MFGKIKRWIDVSGVIYISVLLEVGWEIVIFVMCTLGYTSVLAALGWRKEYCAWSQGPFITMILYMSLHMLDSLSLPAKIINTCFKKKFLFQYYEDLI